MKADRWGIGEAPGKLVLRFGNGEIGTAVALSRAESVRMAERLRGAIALIEQRHGLLWQETSPQQQDGNAARLAHIPAFTDPYARRLHNIIVNLPLTDVEQSFKMRKGQLCSDRFLAGMPVAALMPGQADAIAAAMGAPAHMRAAMREQLEQASFVHIGFDQGSHGCVYKLYYEFDQGGGAAPGLPLYIGYKWEAGGAAAQAVSRYRECARLGAQQLPDYVARYIADPALAALAGAIVELAAHQAGTEHLRLVEVLDDDGARASFDINLYAAGLTIHDLQSQLAALAGHLGIPLSRLDQLITRSGADCAGHLSGGSDRDGQPFLTLYHAAGAAGPRSGS